MSNTTREALGMDLAAWACNGDHVQVLASHLLSRRATITSEMINQARNMLQDEIDHRDYDHSMIVELANLIDRISDYARDNNIMTPVITAESRFDDTYTITIVQYMPHPTLAGYTIANKIKLHAQWYDLALQVYHSIESTSQDNLTHICIMNDRTYVVVISEDI